MAIQKKARPVEAIKNDENMEVMAASLLQLPDEAPTDHEKKQTEKAIPIFKCKIEPKIEEEEDVAVLERKKPRKGSKNARKIQFEGEKTEGESSPSRYLFSQFSYSWSKCRPGDRSRPEERGHQANPLGASSSDEQSEFMGG